LLPAFNPAPMPSISTTGNTIPRKRIATPNVCQNELVSSATRCLTPGIRPTTSPAREANAKGETADRGAVSRRGEYGEPVHCLATSGVLSVASGCSSTSDSAESSSCSSTLAPSPSGISSNWTTTGLTTPVAKDSTALTMHQNVAWNQLEYPQVGEKRREKCLVPLTSRTQ
jgi:hypothetical protein